MERRSTNPYPSKLTLYKLRQDMDVPVDALSDGWGNEINFVQDNEGFRLISAGPDQLFGTADDILYRRVLDQ